MQIYFQNGYKHRVSVAIAIYNPSCMPPWQSQGWWNIDTGKTVYVVSTCNKYLCFYAEASDGAYWAGPYSFQVAEGSFEFCPTASIGYSGATVGMRLVDDNIGSSCSSGDSFTLDLVA